MKRFALVAAVALVVAACGSDSSGDVATLEDTTETTTDAASSEAVDSEEALLEFAQCMRDNGVPDFADPELDESGNLRLFGGSGGREALGDRDTVNAAFEECAPLVEGVIQDTFRQIDQSEFQDKFLEFAQCMREQGVDMPDPDFSGGFGSGLGRSLFGDIDPQDPEFQGAADECVDIFEGMTGPGIGRLGGGNG